MAVAAAVLVGRGEVGAFLFVCVPFCLCAFCICVCFCFSGERIVFLFSFLCDTYDTTLSRTVVNVLAFIIFRQTLRTCRDGRDEGCV